LVLVVITLLATGRTVLAEGWCMFPARAGTTLYAVDLKTGKAREISRLTFEQLAPPAIYKGVLYVGEADNLIALEATTGKRLWGAPIGDGQVIPTEETLYVGGSARALDRKTGKVQWRVRSGRGSWQVLLVGDLLICGMSDENGRNARVCALERNSGKERWQFPLKDSTEPVTWLRLSRASEDLVFLGRTDEGHLLDLKSGRERWSVRADWPPRPESTQSYPSHVICTKQWVFRFKAPLQANPGQGKERGALEAIDVGSRKTRWQIPLPCPIDWDARLWSSGDLVFLVRKDDIHVFQAGTGELLWQAQDLPAPLQVKVAGDAVYILDGHTQLHALDQKTGKRRWRLDMAPKQFGTRVLSGHMTLGEDTLYLLGNAYFDPRWQNAVARPARRPLPR
jgi:outer membrane protein assembly factor BamB